MPDQAGGIRLAKPLDLPALAKAFQTYGRVRIEGLLAAPDTLADHVAGRQDWLQVINSGDKLFELSRAARAAMPADKQQELDEAVYRGARTAFQFRYETIRIPDDPKARRAIGDPLSSFAAWLSDGEMRAALRAITGETRIDFADAQATRYGPGDFLTGHDDRVPGKSRHAAYVFGLTPVWRLEWGGLLTFHEGDARFSGVLPGFNTLDIFRVPILHSVSLISPAAAAPRHAITGWLRSRA